MIVRRDPNTHSQISFKNVIWVKVKKQHNTSENESNVVDFKIVRTGGGSPFLIVLTCLSFAPTKQQSIFRRSITVFFYTLVVLRKKL